MCDCSTRRLLVLMQTPSWTTLIDHWHRRCACVLCEAYGCTTVLVIYCHSCCFTLPPTLQTVVLWAGVCGAIVFAVCTGVAWVVGSR